MIVIHTPIFYGNKVEYPVTINDVDVVFFIKCANWPAPLNPCIDGLVLNLCHMAICNSLEIVSKEPIDELLYKNLMKLPDEYKRHHAARKYLTGTTPVDKITLKLSVPTCKRTPNTSGIVVTPLSMGIDSLYNIIKRKNEITHLMYVKNMDPGYIPTEVETNMEFVSKYFGKKLLIIESNFRNVLIGSKLIASGIMYTGDSMLFALAYPFCPEKVLFNGVGNDMTPVDVPILHPQHPHLSRHYISNQITTAHIDLLKVKKIKYLLDHEPILMNLARVCSNRHVPTDVVKNKHNGLEYLSGAFNCGQCGKCCGIFAYLYMLDKKHPLLNNINYIEKYMREFHDYTQQPRYSTGAIYGALEFDAVYAMYNEQKHIRGIMNYTFTFNEKEIIITKN